jgi:hypothetical protein
MILSTVAFSLVVVVLAAGFSLPLVWMTALLLTHRSWARPGLPRRVTQRQNGVVYRAKGRLAGWTRQTMRRRARSG